MNVGGPIHRVGVRNPDSSHPRQRGNGVYTDPERALQEIIDQALNILA